MRNRRPGFFEAIKDGLRPAVTAILEQLPSAGSGPLEVDLCEFADVLEFAMGVRRRNPQVAAVLLKRERRDGLWFVTQVLLDERDQLVRGGRGLLGRTLHAKAFDDELRDLFGDAESLVVGLPPPGNQETAA